MRVDDVDTPALIVELPAFERNLQRMAGFAKERHLRLRPHAKMHKTPAVALRQIGLGAIGVCCQKTSEAEALVAGGVEDVLISNQVVGTAKLARLAALAQRAVIGVCVDDASNARALSDAAKAASTLIHVYIEINAGANRCGVVAGPAALALARTVASLPNLKFMGLQAYHGSAQHLRSAAERQAAIASAIDKARQSRDLIEAAGIRCTVITGAGTGTYELEAASGVYNELQPGSYAFMDADYGRNQSSQPYEQSLFILTTVMSRSADRAVVDCGLKAHSVDSGMALVAGDASGAAMPGLEYAKASDEHGVILSSGGMLPALGAKLRLIPGHIDPTVNLHDWIIGIRSGVVTEVWPVTARGAMW
jgi:D-serine deaminase-like pyridoxal phosphate-dependent protein